jgi:secreted trypsin-like serine protease
VSTRHGDDIALIRLKEDVQWSDFVQPACLSATSSSSSLSSSNVLNEALPSSSSFSGLTATATGWGLTGEREKGGQRANILQKVNLPILDNAECQLWYKEESMKSSSSKNKSKQQQMVVIGNGSMCAGFEAGGKDACLGDSGGPLVVKRDGRQVVVGLVSTGIGCARPKLPGIYTRVNHYFEWIKSSLLSANKE